jgi:hypothetical protein
MLFVDCLNNLRVAFLPPFQTSHHPFSFPNVAVKSLSPGHLLTEFLHETCPAWGMHTHLSLRIHDFPKQHDRSSRGRSQEEDGGDGWFCMLGSPTSRIVVPSSQDSEPVGVPMELLLAYDEGKEEQSQIANLDPYLSIGLGPALETLFGLEELLAATAVPELVDMTTLARRLRPKQVHDPLADLHQRVHELTAHPMPKGLSAATAESPGRRPETLQAWKQQGGLCMQRLESLATSLGLASLVPGLTEMPALFQVRTILFDGLAAETKNRRCDTDSS